MLLPVAAALWGSGWGCGGVVTDSGKNRDGGPIGAEAGGGSSIPGIPPGVGGSKAKPPSAPSCGNGRLDGSELCDGNSFRTDVDTCPEALMVPFSSGTLYCTPSCTIDTSGCYQSFGGTPNVGGSPNGGYFGYAGRAGGGGMLGVPTSPAQACYMRGGVPDPASIDGCSFGVDATNACFNKPNRTTCADKCGCSSCPNTYDQCLSDGACMWTFGCAKVMGCYSVSSCLQANCGNAIMTAGGPNTPSAALLDQVLACFQANNCPLNCP
jgi:hypothetical protein